MVQLLLPIIYISFISLGLPDSLLGSAWPSMYPVLEKLPGSQYLWMLRFISIALCMILYSFLLWDTLKKTFIWVCCLLLVADVIPSVSLLYSGMGTQTAEENLKELLTFANAAASLITTRKGALRVMPTREEIKNFIQNV